MCVVYVVCGCVCVCVVYVHVTCVSDICGIFVCMWCVYSVCACDICACCMYVAYVHMACVYICICGGACMENRRQFKYSPLTFSAFPFEPGSLLEPGAHVFQLGWEPANPRDSPVSATHSASWGRGPPETILNL